MGVRRFYDRPVGWRQTALITGLGFAGMTFFAFGYDSQPIRMFDLFGRPGVAVRTDPEAAAVA